ncbi:2-hydroxy-3-oxopropionate reductase [Mangrovactinospora gilvigrisea]|uniref:2-hydroxy-3-oxopropionate reductase n=1 Tax=Mangrovactinospora gilvigrisea TaxID=1428644 RepID=A0A1J7BF87_9ACTN|nr:NAD(P)-dependent oxidoreductase [Mangrovactinospora gilvigrisea]OIV37347.1 2-hydroxy-3-oxopropionate reductase [Mangrovactinospora gilvigrisea]
MPNSRPDGAATSEVALLGLGAMGRPMAANLLRAGHATTVWNRTADHRSRDLAAAGAHLAATPAEAAARARTVLTVLPDLPQVEEVLAGPDGLLAGWRSGDAGPGQASAAAPLLVVMGTVSPVGVRELGERLARDGVHVVDAPVSGGDVGAERAELSVMAGGDDADLARLRPVLASLGSTIRHLGPLGSGQLAKAANQIVVAATLTAVSEALLLAERGGLDASALLEVLSGGLAGSTALEVKREKWLSGDFAPGGRAVFQLKDLDFALDAGRASGTPLPLTAVVEQLYAALVANGDGDLDHSAIYRQLNRIAGGAAGGASAARATRSE